MTTPATTLSVGRSRSCSIVVDSPTVSRHHADLILSDDGRCRFEDRGSTAGSYRLEDGTWQRFDAAELDRADQVRIGDYECTLEALLKLVRRDDPDKTGKTAGETTESRPPKTVIERDPATGQIVIRQS